MLWCSRYSDIAFCCWSWYFWISPIFWIFYLNIGLTSRLVCIFSFWHWCTSSEMSESVFCICVLFFIEDPEKSLLAVELCVCVWMRLRLWFLPDLVLFIVDIVTASVLTLCIWLLFPKFLVVRLRCSRYCLHRSSSFTIVTIASSF